MFTGELLVSGLVACEDARQSVKEVLYEVQKDIHEMERGPQRGRYNVVEDEVCEKHALFCIEGLATLM